MKQRWTVRGGGRQLMADTAAALWGLCLLMTAASCGAAGAAAAPDDAWAQASVQRPGVVRVQLLGENKPLRQLLSAMEAVELVGAAAKHDLRVAANGSDLACARPASTKDPGTQRAPCTERDVVRHVHAISASKHVAALVDGKGAAGAGRVPVQLQVRRAKHRLDSAGRHEVESIASAAEMQKRPLRVGDVVAFQVSNSGPTAVYFTVLSVNPQGGREVLYPLVGQAAEDAVAAGGQKVLVRTPFQLDEQVGEQRYEVVAFDEPVDLRAALRGDTEPPTRGEPPRSALGRLMKRVYRARRLSGRPSVDARSRVRASASVLKVRVRRR